MRVLLDGATISDNAANLGEALEAGRAKVDEVGRVIVEVRADGLPAPQEDLFDELAMTREFYADEVEFVTADPRELVAGTFRDAAVAMTQMRETQAGLARLIHAGKTDEGLHQLAEVLKVWDAMRLAIEQGSALLGLGLPRDEQFVTLAEGLSQRLTSLQRAVQAQDWATIADELEYELSDHAGDWAVQLERLAEALEKSLPS